MMFIERIKSIDRRILTALADISAFFCRCCILFLPFANTEPTAAVAQNTAAGRAVVVEEFIGTAESTDTAVTIEVSSDTPNPANTSRLSNTAGLTSISRPTNTTPPTGTPTPSSPVGIETNPTTASDGDLATVTWVIDGDKTDVDIVGTTYRVRYIGMDTAEWGEKLGTSRLIWLWFLLIGRLDFNFGNGLFDKPAYVWGWV